MEAKTAFRFLMSGSHAILAGALMLALALLVQVICNKNTSDRQQVEEALRDSEERLRLALDAACVGIWDWQVQQKKVTWTRKHEELFGLAPGSFDGTYETFDACLHPDDREDMTQAVKRALREGQDYSHEFRVMWPDGSIHWIESRGRVFCDEAGQVVRMLGTVVEITQRKQAEAALRQMNETLEIRVVERTAELAQANSQLQHELGQRQQAEAVLRKTQEQLQAILDYSPAVIHLKDTEGRYILTNRQHELLSHISRADILGKTDLDCFPKETADAFRANDRQVLTAGVPQEFEEVVALNNGTHTYLSVKFPLRDTSGTIYGICGISTDITERKHAEKILRQQAEREHLLGVMTQRIRQSLNLKEILTTTVMEVRQLLVCDRVLIYRVDADGKGSAIAESVASGYPAILHQTLLEETPLQKCQPLYTQGWVRTVTDVDRDEMSRHLADTLRQLEVKAKIVVPILSRKQAWDELREDLWGLLIAHQCSAPRQWQQMEVDLLKQLATQVGIAIQQSQLYQRTQKQAQREQALNRVIRAIRNSLELSTIFDTATTEIGQLLQAHQVVIWQYLPHLGLWRNITEYRSSAQIASCLGQELLDDDNSITLRLKQFEVIQLNDGSADADNFNQEVTPTFPGAWLLVPLHFSSSVWGALGLVRSTQFPWQGWEVELACSITDQLAIAIGQSELYQQVQQLNAYLEEQVQERTAQLQQAFDFEATLKRIADRVRDSLDEDQILQTAVEELALAIGVNACNAALYDLEQRTSTIRYEYTTNLVPLFQGVAVRMDDFPQAYRQLLQGQYFQFCFNEPNPGGQSAVLSCPIFDDQGVLGDLWLINHIAYEFNEQDIRLVQQVANQCAIAIRQSQLYQAAQAQVKELERLNQLKDDFLSTVSHELRTPMSSITMATQMLELNLVQANLLEAESTPVNHYLQILKEECHREIGLIDDLLDLTRLDAHTEPLMLTPIDLQVLIPYIAEPFVERTLNQQQHFEMDIPAQLPALSTDMSYLERILAELLNNACKYTPPGEKITISARKTGSEVQISVSNSGVEIPESERDRVFDKFYRIPNSDRWKHGGTGLGLALVKKLAEHLGAIVELESAEGQTTFLLRFPA